MYVFLRFWVRGTPLKIFESFMMSASNEKAYYAVGRGKEIGIYDSWKECKAQTEGVANAKYRKFYCLEEAKEFVSFWKNYSGKDSVESKKPMEADENVGNHWETKNGDIKVEPASSQLQSPSFAHLQPSSPHAVSCETGILSQKEVDVLALNLRLDSLEKRFDSCLKEFGAATAEISHLVTVVNELKECLRFGPQFGSGSSPIKGKDDLYQTTRSSGTGSNSPSRYFSSQKRTADPGEPDSNQGRSLKRRLSRRCSEDSEKDEIVEKLSKRLKVGEVDLSSFSVDDDGFVQVYTDGCALSNGQACAKAGIGIWFGDNHPLNVSEPVTGRATSITAEIQAARVAIELASGAGVAKLKVFTDSEFLINCITKWIHRWKKNGWTLTKGGPVKNRSELEKLDSAASKITVLWKKVPAHSNVKGNETADRLANAGAAKYNG